MLRDILLNQWVDNLSLDNCMLKIKLIADGNKRWVSDLHYEYFCPVKAKEDFYTKFLFKNFPFEMSDIFNLLPFHKYGIPTI